MMMNPAKAKVLIRKIKKAARKSGLFYFRWGCVVSTAYHDDEGPCLRLDTQAGESMWITGQMLLAVRGYRFFLMGHTECTLESWHVREDAEIMDHVWLILRHQVREAFSPDTLLVLESQYQAGTASPMVLLAIVRPQAWPP